MPTVEKSVLIRWAVDSFLISHGVLFSYGWMVLENAAAEELHLEIIYSDGSAELLPVETGLDRPDVADAIPQAPRNSGFLVFFAIADKAIDTVRLLIERSKRTDAISLELSSALFTNCVSAQQSPSATVLTSLLKKTWEHVRKRQFRQLWSKARRILPSMRAEKVGREALISLLEQCDKNASLIVDHRLGGGANLYRDRLIRKIGETGDTAVLLSFEPSSLRYHLKFFYPNRETLDVCVDQDIWFALAASRRFSTVYFNNCVSFPAPERVPEMLVHLVRVAGTKLVLFMHDHYLICPSHFLLNDAGRYCGLPNLDVCRTCLPRIRDGLVSFYRSRDIDNWRRSWLECLKIADEIVCFAPSGKKSLLAVYPELENKEIQICPHEIESGFDGGYITPATHVPLRIAVVGSINVHKGSEVVLALAHEIERRGLAVVIHVIGNLVAAEKPRCLVETGAYQRENLPALIHESGVHLALMPSICPETFSFVTHELISIGIPVMTFDMGGQAEAARKSPNCRVIPLMEADSLLDALVDFGNQILAQHPEPEAGFPPL